MTLVPPIWLASTSPRRRAMMSAAGIPHEVVAPDIDDARLDSTGRSPSHWVISMAHLKARRGAELLNERAGGGPGTVLAADTVCALESRILGQPTDAADAARMLRLLRNAAHQVFTGVCLLDRQTRRRSIWFDIAAVFVGPLSDALIDDYVERGDWRGKAGAYNLEEAIRAGWPVACTGDPTTVMGLPMQRLVPLLGAASESPARARRAPKTRRKRQGSAAP